MIEPFSPEHLRIARKAARSVAVRTRCYFAIGDMRQAAALGLAAAANSCPPEVSFPAWAERVCRNAVAAELRRMRGPGPGTLRRAATDPETHDPYEERDHARDRRALAATVRRVLARLPEADRALFRRHFGGGETCQALAAERGVTHQAVSERLRRTLERVRQALRAELGDAYPAPTRRSPAATHRHWRRGRRVA